MKKRSFTLLEVLVGISLTALIVGMLMTHFIQSSKLKRQIDQKTTAVLKRKLIQERLTHIFTQLSGGFTCENQKLSFSFYPNLKEDNPVTATLELDDDSLLS